MRGRFRCPFDSTIALILFVCLCSIAQAQVRTRFDIPVQPLADSLRAVGAQTNVNVLFDPPLVAGLTAPVLKGEFTTNQAFTLLLAGTGITHEFMNERTVVLSASNAPAAAKPTSNSDAGTKLEEVIVTAQKREERLQDVPASVTALSGDSLQEKGANSFQDYLNAVPGVSFYQNGGQTNAIFIRGVSSGVNIISSSTTGIYVDEAPVTQSIGGIVDLNPFDLERVEVLRGPQGTLYGAASMGGTVRLIMNKPQFNGFASSVGAKLSDTRNGGTNYEANAMLNLPASNTLAFRLVGGYRDSDGYIDDVRLGHDNANFDKVTTFRGTARWKPNDQADVLFTAAYQKQEYGSHPEAFTGPTFGEYQAGLGYPERGEQPFNLYSLTVSYDLGFGDLTSASSYFQKRAVAVRDNTRFAPLLGYDLAPGEGFALDLIYDAAVFTQEVRLASKTTGRFNWLAGLFYSGGKGPDLTATGESNAPSLAGVDIYTADIPTSQHQDAAFGELGYNVTDKLSVTAGLRFSQYATRGSDFEGGDLVGPDPVDTHSRTSDHFLDQRYSLAYKLTADNLLYAQASSGSRQGNATGVEGLPSVCIDELHAAGFATIPSQTDPDTLWTYEVGSKNSAGRGKLTLSTAAYYTEWKDFQSLVNLECGLAISANSGAAKIKGVEMELTARPIEQLTLNLSGAYTHTEITSPNPSVGARVGDPLPLVPRINANLGSRYDFALPGDAKGYLRADVTYVGAQYADFRARTTGYRVPDYTLVNARLGFKRSRYELALYANNLFNDRVVTFIARNPMRDTLIRPLTIGVDLRADF